MAPSGSAGMASSAHSVMVTVPGPAGNPEDGHTATSTASGAASAATRGGPLDGQPDTDEQDPQQAEQEGQWVGRQDVHARNRGNDDGRSPVAASVTA
jgi:hypothetical protein